MRKASLKRCDPPEQPALPQMEEEVINPSEEWSEAESDESEVDGSMDDRVMEDSNSDDSDSQSGSDVVGQEVNDSGEDDENEDEVEQHVPFQPPNNEPGPGRGRGRGRGAGRVAGDQNVGRVGRGRYVQPPLPSPLHACIRNGSHRRDPTYQIWNSGVINLDPSNGFPRHERGMHLKWSAVRVFPPGFDIPPVEDRELIHYYIGMFPMQYLPVILSGTNKELRANNPRNALLTEHEFLFTKQSALLLLFDQLMVLFQSIGILK